MTDPGAVRRPCHNCGSLAITHPDYVVCPDCGAPIEGREER